MHAIVHEIEGCALVAATIVVGAGWRHEPRGVEGLAHLVEHAHFVGSAGFRDPDTTTRSYGTHVDGRTLAEATTFDFACLREHAVPMLDVLQDVVFRPTFDVGRLAREREIVRSAMLVEAEFAPWEWAGLKLDDMLFDTDGMASLGTPRSFARITHPHVLAWQARHYRPESCCLLLSGDPAALAELLRRVPDHAAAAPSERPTPVRRPAGARTYLRREPDQSPEVCAGFRFPMAAYGPEVELLRVLLGNYPGSRVWRRFREREAIAYTVDASLRLMSDAGRLMVYVGLADVADPAAAWAALVDEIDAVREMGPTPDEVEWAKRVARLDLHRQMLDPERALRSLVSRWACIATGEHGAANPFDGILAGLERQRPEDVARAARAILVEERAAVSVVGNVDDWSLEGALAALPSS